MTTWNPQVEHATTESSVSVDVETITPDLAAEWLRLNKVNRTVRRNRVMGYADQMRRGQWKLTGEPIQRNGHALLNGQHRLLACVEAGVPFTTVVVRGIHDDAMSVMDSGLPRSVGDALRFAGLTNVYQMAAVVRTVMAYKAGITRDTNRMTQQLSRDDQLEFATTHEEALHTAVNAGRRIGVAIGLSVATWGALAYLIGETDAEAASLFLGLVLTGDQLEQGNPIYALRSWAISSAVQRRARPKYQQLGVGIKAWNAWLANDKLRLVKFLPAEEMPEIAQP